MILTQFSVPNRHFIFYTTNKIAIPHWDECAKVSTNNDYYCCGKVMKKPAMISVLRWIYLERVQ